MIIETTTEDYVSLISGRAPGRLRLVDTPIAPVEIPCADGETGPLCDRATMAQYLRDTYGPIAAGIPPFALRNCKHTPEEFAVKSTWGHCTVEYAEWLAIECGVKRLALFHHDPLHDDDQIDGFVVAARRRCESSGLDVFAAREGLTVHVGS